MKKETFIAEVWRLIWRGDRRDRLREAVTMSFLLGTIGDRLGVPMETMSRKQILSRNGGREVETYLDPRDWRICSPDWGVFTRPAQASDDTALMLSSMRAIRRGDGQYQVLHAAMELVHTVLRSDVQGWGGTIRSQAERIDLYFASRGREGRSPHEAGVFDHGMGHGNGAVLRATPLMWAAYLRAGIRYGAPLAKEYIAQQSNANPANRSQTLGWCASLARGPHPGWLKELYEQLFEDAVMTHSDHQYAVRASRHFFEVLDALPVYSLLPARRSGSNMFHLCVAQPAHGKNEVLPYLRELINVSSSASNLEQAHLLRTCSIDRLVNEIGTDGNAAESVPLAMWIAIRHADDPRAAVIEAVNAGGDTDSVAFLVGQLVGFYSMLDQLPEEWIEGEVGDELLALVREELVPFLDCFPQTLNDRD